MSVAARTVVQPYQARALVSGAKALLESLAKLPTLAPDDTPARLVEIVPKYAALLKTVNEIVDRRDFLPPGNVVVVYGPEADQILEGIAASFYMKQVDKLAVVLCDLGNRWGWGGYVRPDRGVDAERMMADVDRFTEPSVGPNDLARIEGALNVFLRHHVDLSHLTQEVVSRIPPPIRRGPDSWKEAGLTPFHPAETRQSPGGRDFATEAIATGKLVRDITGWERWPLDRPYRVISVEGVGGEPGMVLQRVEEHAGLVFRPTDTEFRLLLRSAEGEYYLLGAPSNQWYRNRLTAEDGSGFVLLNEPSFHGELSLVPTADRIMFEVEKEVALDIWADSGYGAPPPDLEELLIEASGNPTPPAPTSGPAEEGLAALHRKHHPRAALPAAFLGYMEDRDRAEFTELADHVYGDAQTADGTIRVLVHRINRFLEKHEVATRFIVGAGLVIKDAPSR